MRVVVIGSLAGSLVYFRGDMIQAMVAAGHEVIAVAPGDDLEVGSKLAEMGVEYVSVPMTRAGLDPLQDWRTLRALHGLMRERGPDIVLAYTAKPVIYGLIGARWARVPLRAAMISGRGSALAGGVGLKRRLLARLTRSMYAIALRGAHVVFFQNPDDEAMFRSQGIVGRSQRRVRINGSGVDLQHFAPAPLPDGALTFLMVGRLLREKGAMEFAKAAQRVRSSGARVRFQHLGGLDSNPGSLSEAELGALQAEGNVEYISWATDVRPIIAGSHVVVLPSYHEGTPRSILEGMSMGRAVITTDVPGCRETVEPGRNGVLVPARDADALADAMLDLVAQPELASEMGRESRRLAEERFDVHAVNRVILKALGL